MRLKRRRHDAPGPGPPDPHHVSNIVLTTDVLRTWLEVMKDGVDIFPPLKSSVGLALALWNLADSVSASKDQVEALAFRASSILNAMHNALSASPSISAELPPLVLEPILQFEAVLTDSQRTLERMSGDGWRRRLLHLRQNKSLLDRLAANLQSAHDAFTVAMQSTQAVYLARVNHTTGAMDDKLSTVSESLNTANVELTQLRRQVHFLQLSIVFLG
ncbi:hypothetical protein C8F01DRAFT_1140644 [Mycena amicta]|nr:hypothetical protein C8F01DRAFT_1140644 [Mycena amicta]